MSTTRQNPNAATTSGRVALTSPSDDPVDGSFAEVVGLIEQARQRAYQAVNSELVGPYWSIGEYISAKLAAAVWGEGVVDSLAQHLARTIGDEISFTCHFYKPQPRRTLAEISADTLAIEKEAEGLLDGLLVTKAHA